MAHLRFLIIVFVFLLATPAFAQMNVTAITSAYSRATGKLVGEVENATTTITTLFGGTAGSCDSTSPGALCNSCTVAGTTTGTTGCNRRRIHDDLHLTVTFNYPSGDPGNVIVTTDVNPTDGQVELRTENISGGTISSGSGVTAFATIAWGEICDIAMGASGAGCDGVASTTSVSLRFGIDSDGDDRLGAGEFTNDLRFQVGSLASATTTLCQTGDSSTDGVCNFIAFPGDEKIFLEDVKTGCDFPSITGSNFDVKSVRVYYEEEGSTFPTILSPNFKDLAIGETSQSCSKTKSINLSENEVKGLINDKKYLFAVGVVDEANNVGFVTQMTGGTVVAEPDNDADTSACFDTTGAASENANCHLATPEEVIGLIEKEFDCFITTATYGTPFRPKVEDFRAFRNQYLHTTWLGRKIIKFYYRSSPPLADWIRSHPWSKPVMRIILWPFWAMTKVILISPFLFLFLIFVPILAFFLFRIKKESLL